MNKRNVISFVIGSVMLFGTVFLISKAWKKGQK